MARLAPTFALETRAFFAATLMSHVLFVPRARASGSERGGTYQVTLLSAT